MIVHNPQATRRPYDAELAALLNADAARAAREALAHWPLLARQPTPLWSLPGRAAALGLAAVDLKDESRRSPLVLIRRSGSLMSGA